MEEDIDFVEDVKEDTYVNTNVIEKVKHESLKSAYNLVLEVLKEFIDTKEENYKIIAIWIVGTWFHKEFQTYPYLYINAMKGSGKTRLLSLIKELSWRGDMLVSISEAVLFRTVGTLCIDEFEGVGSRDKNALRELLNTSYKKGGKVKRMKEKRMRDVDGNMCREQVVEEFSTYRPIAMANIRGMEEILGDRCISIVLEKSGNSLVTRKIENFEKQIKISKIKELIHNLIKCSADVQMCMSAGQSSNEWNSWLDVRTSTSSTPVTPTTLATPSDTHIYSTSTLSTSSTPNAALSPSVPLSLSLSPLSLSLSSFIIINYYCYFWQTSTQHICTNS